MKEGTESSHCIKNKQFWGVETSRNILSALVIVHGHFLGTVSPQRSFMAWSMESEERTGLSHHMDPFPVTNPVHWHLELPFREIFDRLAVWSDRGFLHSCVILFMLSNNQEVVPLSPLNSGKSSWNWKLRARWALYLGQNIWWWEQMNFYFILSSF